MLETITKALKIVVFCFSVVVLIDALLPSKRSHHIFEHMEYKVGKSFKYYDLFFKDQFKCSAYTDEQSLSSLIPNELFTVNISRITHRCVGIAKNGTDIYQDTYWRLIYLACALFGIAYGTGKIKLENWWKF